MIAVSVIVPLFDGADHIEACLTSVAGQSHLPAEVIVVDDGSSDDGPRRAAAHHVGARVIAQANAGPAAARNTGIRAATGSHLAFIDQDDLWHPDKLALQVAAFEDDPAIELCYGKVDLFWDQPDCAEARHFRDHRRGRNVPGYIGPTLLARRSAFDRVGPLDETLRFGDGSAWAARARDLGLTIRMLDKVVLYHRMHAGNLTRKREESAREFLSILHERLKSRRRLST